MTSHLLNKLIICCVLLSIQLSAFAEDELETWEVRLSRQDHNGWGRKQVFHDLHISSSGRYEFLDRSGTLAECEGVTRELTPEDLATLNLKLRPVLKRYELVPRIRSHCSVSDGGISQSMKFEFQTKLGRAGKFELRPGNGWCDRDKEHQDVRVLETLLVDLSIRLDENCKTPPPREP